MGTLFDVTKSANNKEKLTTLKYRLYLALLADVDTDNWPESVEATISTNVLLAGKTYKYIDCKTDSIKPNAEPGESPYAGKLKLTPTLEGLSKNTLNWVYSNMGNEVIAVWERCSDGQKFIGGSPCSGGLIVKLTKLGDLDGGISGASLSLEGGECPEPFLFYDGDIIRESPTLIDLGAGTTFAISTGSQYKMPDNTAAVTLTDITGVTDADVGRIFEIVGAGVNFPTSIASSAKFILANGLSFSCADGTAISFKITKTGTGTYAFYEVLRKS